jgi:hypothetical protein
MQQNNKSFINKNIFPNKQNYPSCGMNIAFIYEKFRAKR